MSEQSPDEVVPEVVAPQVMGRHLDRQDGVEKVTGEATYAVEHPVEGDLLHAWLVTSTVARGRVVRVDASAALEHPGVEAVLDHESAPRLADTEDRELAVLQDDRIGFRGQVVALVLATSSEAAREGAALVAVHQDAEAHEAAFAPGSATYAPEEVNAGAETDTVDGDPTAALAAAPVVVDAVYETPHEYNSPMEPHAATALWDGERLTLHDSTQGVHPVRATLAPLLGLEPEQVRVLAPYVGGGFGSKGLPHAPEVAVALAALSVPGRPVRLAVTRQQMFALTGYRTATRSRVRLGAEPDGRLVALRHDAESQTSRIKEFAEQTATAARMMYAAPHRATTHRVAELDVAVPSWMRAPGEMPGMYAHEVAMDELAVATGVDPIDLRVRNEPEVDPETGNPFNDRRLVECLHRGAELFGWAERPEGVRARAEGDWWVGTGVASATYPMLWMPGNGARVRSVEGGRYEVAIGAVDIGTGARTVLLQVASDALGCPPEAIDLLVADSELPFATVAGGSSGTSSWGTAIAAAAQQFRADHGEHPDPGVATTATSGQYADMSGHSLHSFGAVFAETHVHRWTGEVRVERLLGVYSVGRVINPTTARSQLLGGLVMGLSAALHEEGWRDPRFGHTVTQDLATYHVAAHADVRDLRAEWLEEEDHLSTPMGSRGIGEIGIVGTAAAIANATHHATGVRVRSLPVTADHFLDLPALAPEPAGKA
ncbi:xanthine dehydrogenase family protein molybdopterin-binding subunit [Nocardioides sp. ChNu-153]|uniref:xanthine dehydrogenase family protein molybdopterin-binding subunit n=1 Tax=unclassified Nocardioides TaxID=2615069 RepID=UPI0024055B4C|nr:MULTISPECIES: xanthine dehydrogenase family protein molybdopterin-binding subunit [unclassified Nocardioides]MDF9715656.1 xanthine dehydrogenase family protein molybdopterin-binding subunit [Nocardioides sp. ChNu-99]MDN7121640.1 xanthine dehydrogenase family protein molybdopterin-binding subunit [Nocardioides sp. ChNu-153]